MPRDVKSSSFFVFISIISCTSANFSSSDNPKKNQTGATEASPGSPKNPSDSPGEDSPRSRNGGPCTEKNQLTSELLTSSIVNGAPGTSLKYAMKLTSCDGKPRPIGKGTILFDYDVLRATQTISKGLRFTLVVGKKSFSGMLEAKEGSDLFGNNGNGYYHYENTEALETPIELKSGTLEIFLGGERLQPRIPNLRGGEVFSFRAYLKFGPPDPIVDEVEVK